MQFRFTIFNSILAPTGIEVMNPIDWQNCKLILQRHAEYHSLVEYFEGDFLFTGSALSLLQDIESTQGVDAKVNITVEVSFTINLWENLFSGLIDLSLLEEFSKGVSMYKMKAPIIQSDLWSKFYNRRSVPVDLSSTVDLDGNARTPVNSFTLPLPSQKIHAEYYAKMYEFDDEPNDLIYPITTSIVGEFRVGQIQLPVVQKNEVDQVFTLSPVVLDVNGVTDWGNYAASNFIAKYKGTYEFNLRLFISTVPYRSLLVNGDQVSSKIAVRVYKNGVAVSYASYTDLGVNGSTGRTRYYYSNSFDLEPNDSITYLIEGTIDADDQFYVIYNNWFENEVSYVSFIAGSIAPDSTSASFKIKSALESILSKVVGDDEVLESSILDGCYGKYALQKGLHIRGYSLVDKPFAMSFDQWWQGANPILNLGLGYTPAGKIIVEKKEYFYNETTSLNLSNIKDIIRSYDLNKFFKTIQIGYDKYSSESTGGIDDPQTKRTWRTRFSTLGKDEKLLSTFIAASIAIEQTRRNSIEAGKDWKFDEDIFIISLNDTDEPEFDESFQTIADLQNSGFRYNIRLSCARNFERWREWFNGCLQHDITEKFYFAQGEGNSKMYSELKATDCEYVENPGLTENQDIDVTSSTLIPKKYTFSHPLRWVQYKIIRDNREKAIGLSRSTDSHTPHFIDKLEYPIMEGEANFTVLLAKNPTELNGFRLLEDGNFRLLEDGNFLLL